MPTEPSVVGLSLNETCLEEGTTVSLRCNIRGFPHPSIEFQQNGIEVTPGEGEFENIVLEYYNQVRSFKLIDLHDPWHAALLLLKLMSPRSNN